MKHTLLVAIAGEQGVDQLRAFVCVCAFEKSRRHLHRRDASDDVEVDTANEDLVMGRRIGRELFLLPSLGKQGVVFSSNCCKGKSKGDDEQSAEHERAGQAGAAGASIRHEGPCFDL